jgi:hypothetical protein
MIVHNYTPLCDEAGCPDHGPAAPPVPPLPSEGQPGEALCGHICAIPKAYHAMPQHLWTPREAAPPSGQTQAGEGWPCNMGACPKPATLLRLDLPWCEEHAPAKPDSVGRCDLTNPDEYMRSHAWALMPAAASGEPLPREQERGGPDYTLDSPKSDPAKALAARGYKRINCCDSAKRERQLAEALRELARWTEAAHRNRHGATCDTCSTATALAAARRVLGDAQ